MRKVTLEELEIIASICREDIYAKARSAGRDPKIYLHWTAGFYNTLFDDYHINITGDGEIYLSTDDLSQTLPHTWHRNTGAIGVTICACYNATSEDLGAGGCPPTKKQIEVMAQVVAHLSKALWLTIDKNHVLNHSEAADNFDNLNEDADYGALTTCERWDLHYLGTDESPAFVYDYNDPSTGGNVLRGKANWYANHIRE